MSHLHAVEAPRAPASVGIEREVLAAVLVKPELIRAIRAKVGVEAFYSSAHQALFVAMCRLDDRGIPSDPVTLLAELDAMGAREIAGGSRVVGELLDRVGLASHLPYYLAEMRTQWAHRRIAAAGEAVTRMALEGHDIGDTMALVDAEVRKLAREVGEVSARAGSAALLARQHEEMVNRTEAASAGGGTLAFPFGFRALDDALHGGLWPGEQCVVMGARSHGKSALAGQLITTNARGGRRCVFVSAEMPPEQVFMRLVANVCGVPAHVQRSGKMNAREREEVATARAFVGDWPLDIVSAGGKAIKRIAREVERIARESDGIALIVLDYAQKVSKGGMEPEPALSEISGTWKALALDLGCASVLLSQPVTAATRHQGPPPHPRPSMADSKGAGSVPDDADVFLVVHRPWFSDKTRDADKRLIARTEIAIDKQREGSSVGTVIQARFRGDRMSFEEDNW